MSLFGSIMNKIFHHGEAAAAEAPPGAAASAPAGAAPAQASGSTGQPVDVGQILAGIAAKKGGGGNWRTSIVDLLKMLDLDSSLGARKELAAELNVHAGADGSAEQNIALSKAVWAKLGESGGNVDALRH
jgi:hypothetical protein